MTTHTFGTVTVTTDDNIKVPLESGNLSPDEIRRLANPLKGIGKACDQAAGCLEKSNGMVVVSDELSPETLRALGEQAEKIDQVIDDLEVLLHKFKQANTILDAEAFKALRRLYGVVKSEAAFSPNVKKSFAPLYEYFAAYGGSANGAASSSESAAATGDPEPQAEVKAEAETVSDMPATAAA